MHHIRRFLYALPILFAFAAPAAAQDAQARLWDAAVAGDTAAIRKAVNDGARVDSLDLRANPNGRYALNWAVWNNRVPAVKLLIELKAPLEKENLTGFTALHHAAESGSLEAARVLVEAGADPDHTNGSGMKPSEVARDRGNDSVAALIEAAPRKKPK
jgi:uncharacterized protein